MDIGNIWANLPAPLKLKVMAVGGVIIVIFLILISVFVGEEDGNAKTYLDDINKKMVGSGTCSYKVNDKAVENIKVRLLDCTAYPQTAKPIKEEPLIDFETYILGVAYAEIDPPESQVEAFKAQLIAARSFALTRVNAAGTKLEKNGNDWILNIRNCEMDQVFCNPNQGCSREAVNSSTGKYLSGLDKPKTWKPVLAEDSWKRKAAEEVAGQVAVDKNGNTVMVNYTSTEQNSWKQQAENGKSALDIIVASSSKVATVSSGNCTLAGTGDHWSWKQRDPRWGNIPIGITGGTVASIGCTTTSTCMQIAASGVSTTTSPINPGICARTFNYTANGLIMWQSVTSLAPNFSPLMQRSGGFSSESELVSFINDFRSKNQYGVMFVTTAWGTQHWVSIVGTNGGKVVIADPDANTTTLDGYYTTSGIQAIQLFSVK